MSKKTLALVFVFMFSVLRQASAETATIVAHEDEKFFLVGEQMVRYEGQYENTYFLDLEKNTLVRTRVYDFQTKQITPDNTVYQVQPQLNSYPKNALRFGTAPTVRAFGQTGVDSVEIVVIKDDSVETLISAPNSTILSKARRLK